MTADQANVFQANAGFVPADVAAVILAFVFAILSGRLDGLDVVPPIEVGRCVLVILTTIDARHENETRMDIRYACFGT
jgi:hypothetical protein